MEYTSGTYLCRHCGNTGKSEVLHREAVDRAEDAPEWEVVDYYFLVRCPVCGGISLVFDRWIEGAEDEDRSEVYWPANPTIPKGLPRGLADEFQTFLGAQRLSAALALVQARRILELVCEDRLGDSRDSLYKQLEKLAADYGIPSEVAGIAHGLRELGNLGAHANRLSNPSAKEVEVAQNLCIAVLEYVYTLPHLLSDAQRLLARARGKPVERSASKPDEGP